MKIKVKLFAFLGEHLGSEVEVDLPEQTNEQEVKQKIIALDPQVKQNVELSRIALNQEFITKPEFSISENSELALIPPVSGG
ncbi:MULTISPECIES: MoaD/ThiS family protein [Lactobacillus]|uniref:MoaD/ThiS family protein n=1 Tax=Lactobacillus xujianguonis TaxID=2495899 RepID=A0A437SVS7_9LACO|nr:MULTISPECIES: MoaD/ThiS family protein [Lactobacillus]RVU71028.1 MoaD/ThiS family protein [Lactobacillus xujianguonis]RVU73430.1 MoaD/ThiS family protein [Lactobacillus xujianguonis]